MSKPRNLVNQQGIAEGLGLTSRRVRQLVEEKILPPPNTDGGYDLALCRERYDLYRSGSDADWIRFYDDAEKELRATARLFQRACSKGAKLEDVTRASIAVQANTATMSFMTACKSPSKAEADFHHLIWQREEDRALGELVTQSMKLMGATKMVDEETGEVLVDLEKAFA